VVGVRVRRGRKPTEERQHRNSRPETAQHDRSIVRGGS
jgi:hypothetical protein